MLVAILAAFIVTWLVAPLTIKLAFKLEAPMLDFPIPDFAAAHKWYK